MIAESGRFQKTQEQIIGGGEELWHLGQAMSSCPFLFFIVNQAGINAAVFRHLWSQNNGRGVESVDEVFFMQKHSLPFVRKPIPPKLPCFLDCFGRKICR